MTWIGPRADDLGTPIAWLMTTLFVLAAIQVAEDRPGEVITDPTGTTTTTTSSSTSAAGAPTILSVSPASGSMDGGTEVRIVGRHIDEGATVRFDASAAIVTSFFETDDDEGPIQELIVTAPAHDADTVTVTVENPDGQTGSRERAYVFVDYDATTTSSTSTSATTTSTTTSATTTSTTTSTSATGTSTTTTTTTAPVVEDHSDVVWAFENVDADPGTTYSFLGIWPHDGQANPMGPVAWYTHRLGQFDVTGSSSEQTLGDLTITPDTDTVEVDGDHQCVKLRMYAFDEDAYFIGGIAGSTDYQRFPWAASFRIQYPVDYYYLGEGERPQSCARDWPSNLDDFRDDLLAILEGRSVGEAAMTVIPESSYDGPFNWGDLTLAGQIEGIQAT